MIRPKPDPIILSLAEHLAEIAQDNLSIHEDYLPLDGDDTEELAELFLSALNKLNGNV